MQKCVVCYSYFPGKVSVIIFPIFLRQNSRCKELAIHRDLSPNSSSRLRFEQSCAFVPPHRRRLQSPVGWTELEGSGASRQARSTRPTGTEAGRTSPQAWVRRRGSAPGSGLGLGRVLPALPDQLLPCFWDIFFFLLLCQILIM